MTCMQLVAYVPQLRNSSAGVTKVFSQFGHTRFFLLTWTNTDSVQQVITLFIQSRSRGGGSCHTLWGNCLLRALIIFPVGHAAITTLKGPLLLVGLWIPIFILESEEMVKSLGEPVPNPCELSCSAIYSITWWHWLCCPTLCLNELFKNALSVLGRRVELGWRQELSHTPWFSGSMADCWQGVCCAGGRSAEGSVGIC